MLELDTEIKDEILMTLNSIKEISKYYPNIPLSLDVLSPSTLLARDHNTYEIYDWGNRVLQNLFCSTLSDYCLDKFYGVESYNIMDTVNPSMYSEYYKAALYTYKGDIDDKEALSDHIADCFYEFSLSELKISSSLFNPSLFEYDDPSLYALIGFLITDEFYLDSAQYVGTRYCASTNSIYIYYIDDGCCDDFCNPYVTGLKRKDLHKQFISLFNQDSLE